RNVTGVQTCALPISTDAWRRSQLSSDEQHPPSSASAVAVVVEGFVHRFRGGGRLRGDVGGHERGTPRQGRTDDAGGDYSDHLGISFRVFRPTVRPKHWKTRLEPDLATDQTIAPTVTNPPVTSNPIVPGLPALMC